ncbi:MAG: NBR1-Ig-like domain-containing protein [Anaerolineaceae bacterium]|nr:NBR1-Ig-like domain-containing protein [Anaerolineaceae bacterium]
MKPVIAFSITFLVVSNLVACNPAANPGSIKGTSDVLASVQAPSVAMTRTAAMSASAIPLPSPLPSDTPFPALPPTQSPTVAITPWTPSPTPACNRAAAGNPIDITVPDETILRPGEVFTKTWRLLNTGVCTWTGEYSLVWFSGNQLKAPVQTFLSSRVEPGHGIDLSLDMQAPDLPGTYQSNWKLQNSSGMLFGIGPNGDAPFWVRIIVAEPEVAQPSATNAMTPTAAIYLSGLANLRVDEGLDLDTNQVNNGAADDVVFRQPGGNAFELIPQNKARLGVFGLAQPVIEDCRSASLKEDAIGLNSLATGTYICYSTNQGLPGSARLVFLNASAGTLTLEILTWSIP